MKRIILFLAFVSSLAQAYAANNLCVFKTSTGTYTELTNDIAVTSSVIANDTFNLASLSGETFSILGKPVALNAGNNISIWQNGRVQVLMDTGFAIFDALNTTNLDTIDNTSAISYKIDGSGSQKIIKVQWKNFKVSSGPAGNFINMQTWIYQETGIVEYRYGPRSANNASGYTTPATGLYIGIWYSNYDFSKMYEKIQVIGSWPNFSIDSALNLNVPHIQGAPEAGTIFRFIPKQVAAGVDDVANNAIAIFPNPSSNITHVSIPGEAVYTITDISGKVLKNGICSKTKPVDVSALPNGIHTLSVHMPNSLPYSKQICIAH